MMGRGRCRQYGSLELRPEEGDSDRNQVMGTRVKSDLGAEDLRIRQHLRAMLGAPCYIESTLTLY